MRARLAGGSSLLLIVSVLALAGCRVRPSPTELGPADRPTERERRSNTALTVSPSDPSESKPDEHSPRSAPGMHDGTNSVGAVVSSAATPADESPAADGPFATTLRVTSATSLDGLPDSQLSSALDGDPATLGSISVTRRFRVHLAHSRPVTAIALLPAGEGTLSFAVQRHSDATLIAGLESVHVHAAASARWRITSATSAVPSVDGIVVTWTPSSPSAQLPEITFLGRAQAPATRSGAPLADQIASGIAHPAFEVAASPASVTISTPAALDPANPQSVQFRINVAPESLARAFLTFELSGLPHWTAVTRRINDSAAAGGFHAISGSQGGLNIEEIPVAALVRGENRVRYEATDRAGAVGYTLRNVRLLAFTRADAVAADATLSAGGQTASLRTGGATAADPRPLVDGRLTTGTNGTASSAPATWHAAIAATGYSLNYPTPVQPVEIAFHIAHPLAGSIQMNGGSARAHQRIALTGLAAGWHKAPLDGDAFGPTDAVRVEVRAGRESAGFVSEVQVTSLPLAAPDANAPRLALFNPIHGECVVREGVAIRGALTRSGSDLRTASLYVDGVRDATTFGSDGAFAVTVPEPTAPHANWRVVLRAVFPDGVEATKTIALDVCATESTARARTGAEPIDDVGAPFGVVIHPNEAKTISYGGVRLEIPAGAVDHDTRITVRPLAAVQQLDEGMGNVSPNGGGFRLGPLRSQFLRPVRLTLPYDASRIPDGMTAQDIRAFFFNETSRRWQAITTVAAADAGEIAGASDHFTDYIAASITTPEHPGSVSFNPNTIRDIKVGDPSAGVTLIEPPTANSMGSSNVSFPISLPPGRGGLQPSISVNYSSDHDNGWVGVGWNLEVPHIEIDTRFGVPDYRASLQDDQRYLLNGALLVRVSGSAISGTTEYARRVEGSFDRIVRRGTAAGNFTWEVTDRSGTRFSYGTTAPTFGADHTLIAGSRLTDPHTLDEIFTNPHGLPGAIFRWNLETVRDAFFNEIRYTYTRETNLVWSGHPRGEELWAQLYLAKIEYSIDGRTGAHYEVDFELIPRPLDTISNARAGFEVRTTKLLERIQVLAVLGSGLPPITQREYRLDYTPGAFNKPLLSAIVMNGRDATREMYQHKFGYFGATGTDPGLPREIGFDNATPWSGVADGLIHESFHAGGGIQGYTGVALACFMELGINVGFGPTFDWTTRGMVDLNGDGLPDLFTAPVNRDAEASIMLNHLNRASADRRGGGFVTALPRRANGPIAAGYALQGTVGTAANAPPFGGADLSFSFGTSRQYRLMSDVDGDGLVDLAETNPDFAGGVGTIHVLRNPYTDFTTAGFPAFGCVTRPFGCDETREYDIGGFHRFERQIQLPPEVRDVVRGRLHQTMPVIRWTAPRSGIVVVSGAAHLVDPEGGGEVVVSILRPPATRGGAFRIVWNAELTGDTSARPGGGSGDGALIVGDITLGDRLYFIVRPRAGRDSTDGDEVDWNPTVRYTTMLPCPTQGLCGITNNTNCVRCPDLPPGSVFAQAPDYRLVPSSGGGWTAPSDGVVSISGILHIAGPPPGTRVRVALEHRERPTFTPHDPIDRAMLEEIARQPIPEPVLRIIREVEVFGVDIDPSATLPVQRGDHLSFEVIAANDQEYFLDPALIFWRPRVRYTEIVTDELAGGSARRAVTGCHDGGPGEDRRCTLAGMTAEVPESTVQWDPEPVVRVARTDAKDPMQGFYRGWSVGEWDASLTLDEANFRAPEKLSPKAQDQQVRGAVDAAEALLNHVSPPDAGVPLRFPTVVVPVGGMTRMQPHRSPAPWRLDPVVFPPDSWIGTGADGFVGRGRMKPSRTGGVTMSSDGQVRFETVRDDRITRGATLRAGSSSDFGVTLAGPMSGGLTVSTGTGDEEFFDFDGDRRPDSIRYEGSESTGHLSVSYQSRDGSGFSMPERVGGGFGALRHVDHTAARTGLSLSAENIRQCTQPGGSSREAASASVSFALIGSRSITTVDWQDINGDGLPDHVRRVRRGGVTSLNVQLNLGHSLGVETSVPYENWGEFDADGRVVRRLTPGELSQDGNTTTSLQGAWRRIGAGAQLSTNATVEQLVDLNGDGLPDRVLHRPDGHYFVMFNIGSGRFGPQVKWRANGWGPLRPETALTSSIGFGGNISAGIPWTYPAGYICFMASIAAHADTAFSSAQIGFEDIDGDGHVDHVMRRPGLTDTWVRLNRTGRANLLRSVTRPLGGSFELEYSRQGNFVSGTSTAGSTTETAAVRAQQRGPDDATPLPVVMPHSQWALTAVTVNDGRALAAEPGHIMTTHFDYFDSGFFDRTERESYGYSHVRTRRPDDSRIEAYFYNQDYWRRGLPGLTEERAATAGNPLLRSSRHHYTLLAVTPPIGSAPPRVQLPAEDASSSTLHGASATPGLTTGERRDYAQSIAGSNEWVLDTIHDDGDLGTAHDDVEYKLEYFVGGAAGTRCIRASSIRASVTGGDALLYLPWRTATFDSARCFMTSVSDRVSGSSIGEHSLTTTITYDSFGNVESVTDPTGYSVTYERDRVMHQYVVGTTDVFGYHSSATWDYGLGAPLQVFDINGQKQSFAYDEFGRVIAVYAPGDPISGDSSRDATVTFAYSVPLDATALIPAYAVTHHRSLPGEATIETSTFMDGFGRVIQTKRDSVIEGANAMTASGAVRYDLLGRTRQQGQPASAPAGSATVLSLVPMTNPTSQLYDAWGRVIRTDFPDTTFTTTAYDLSAVAPADNTSGATSWMRVETTDPLGRHHETYRDAAGRILQVTEFNQLGTSTTLSTLNTRYAYDALGRLERVLDAATPPHTTTVTYDSLGRRTSIRSPDTGLTEYRFDIEGNLAERVTPNLRLPGRAAGAAIRNTYVHGRLERVDYPALMSGASQPSTVFAYGAACPAPCLDPSASIGHTVGRVASRTDASGVTTFQYGTLGETTQTTQLLTSPDAATPPFVGPYVTHYEHDRFGRMRNVTYPNGERVDYRYDAGGALSRVEFDRGDDGAGTYVREILYNEFGQRTQIAYGNGVVSHYTYTDAMRRLDTLTTDNVARERGGARDIRMQNIQYTYALNGNITSMVDHPEVTGRGELASLTHEYEYDALDQLRRATGNYTATKFVAGSDMFKIWNAGVSQYTSTFEYDALGRMTRNQQNEAEGRLRRGVTTVRTTATRDLLYAYDSVANPAHAPASIRDADARASIATTIYHWDANGNQSGSGSAATPDRRLDWDDENRLVQFREGRFDATRFVYDAGGTRTHKISASAGTLTLYPNQFTSVRRTTGGGRSGSPGPNYDLTTNHVYAGEQRVASNVIESAGRGGGRRPRQAFWYHGDHLSSTNYVTNETGEITEHLEYFPYGEPWIQEDGSPRVSTGAGTPERFLFTAKELDSETGLYYFGARYYDPRIALWASADPMLASYLSGGTNGGVWNPGDLGLYSYSWNSPVWLSDPDGREVTVTGSLRPPHIYRDSMVGRSGREILGRTTPGPINVHFGQHSVPGGGSELDLAFTLSNATITLDSSVTFRTPDPWVPGRTVETHEAAHLTINERILTPATITDMLAQVGFDMRLSGLRTDEVLTMYREQVMQYIGAYRTYIGDMAMHREAAAAGAHTMSSVPQFWDARAGEFRSPSEADLNRTINRVAAGIPGFRPLPVAGSAPTPPTPTPAPITPPGRARETP